jgi:ABC-type polysaccharide/polyol phosphate transport system ATPase subunit
MAEDIVIRVEGLGKKYIIGHESERERYTALRDVAARTAHNFWKRVVDAARGRAIIRGTATEEFWALKEVSFEVKRGQVLGIIGRNGAGKSTLLKILSRITEPSEGRVTITGRVASLLEVGTGFHPELTGRENIYLNGAILGMSRAEIRRKFDEIVDFSGVEKFIDTPVKRYSSGMYVRLAFAVAAHLEPEILVVDEVLAVGDAEFQKKCLGKISEIAGGGRTVLFVSHNMAAIEALCPRSIHLATKVVQDGKTDQVVASYLEQRHARPLHAEGNVTTIQDGLVLQCVRIAPPVVRTGDAVELEFTFLAERGGQMHECAALIYSAMNFRVAIVDVRESGTLPIRFEKGRFRIRTQIAALPLVEGVYTVGLYVVTDRFKGNKRELEDFAVSAARSFKDFAPYPANARGIVALKAESTVAVHQTEVA